MKKQKKQMRKLYGKNGYKQNWKQQKHQMKHNKMGGYAAAGAMGGMAGGMAGAGMMQPGMHGGMSPMQGGMMQPGGMMPMSPGMPGMMQPGMMQPGMPGGMMPMQPGMPGMMQPGMMQPGMMHPGMQPGMMPMQPGMPMQVVQQAQVMQPQVVQPTAIIPQAAPMMNTNNDYPPAKLDSQYTAKSIHLVVKSAKDLYNPNWTHPPDPYAVIFLDGEKVAQTKVANRSCSVTWNFATSFLVQPGKRNLTIKVWDKDDFTADDYIGEADLNLDTVTDKGFFGELQMLRKKKKKAGVLNVELEWQTKSQGQAQVGHAVLHAALSTKMKK